MAVIRVLEYSGISVSKAIYSKFSRNKEGANRIVDVTGQYRMFELINSVNSFSNFGNSYELEAFFSFSDNEAIKETISAMNDFSDAIAVCRTADLSAILERLNNALELLQNTRSESVDMLLFQQLISLIRQKFYMENNRLEYPSIVRWCLDNRLIQQAVTIYVEKMPEYFFKKGIITVSESEIESLKTTIDKQRFDLFYKLFYDSFLTYSPESKLYNLLKRVVSQHDPKRHSQFDRSPESRICRSLVECNDSDSFLRNTSRKEFSDFRLNEMRADLKRFFKLRNIIYPDSNEGNAVPTELLVPKLKDFHEYAEMISNKTHTVQKNRESFIKYLSNNRDLCTLITSNGGEGYTEKRLNCIENLSDLDNNAYSIAEDIPVEELQTILRDIYFAKIFLRNKLNHASKNDFSDDEICGYFSSFGYQVEREMSVSEIREFMYKAIGRLTNHNNI